MMAPKLWLAVLGMACSVGLIHLAAVPTDTVVVASSNDVKEPASSIVEPLTEEPTPPIKLTEMQVTSTVSLRYAHTAVVAHVRNPAKKAQEAHFRVLLPETAFISGFVMTLDGKPYKAYVKEKEEAKQTYQDAVSQGLGAGLVSAKARNSNHFTVKMQVLPFSMAIFNLTYEEMLVRRNGVYNHVINLHPGAVVPKLTVTVHISESEKITELRVPEVRTGNEIDATKDDAQNTKAVIERGHDDREVTITFKPDLEEQKQLMQIYAEKSKESGSHKNSLSFDEDNKANTEGVLGQFVVQYDVDRSNGEAVLVNDGYFVHFFAPDNLPVLNKYVIFVLDTSGSMMGRKIEQLREAMQTILADLNPGDYFSIVEFASSVTIHGLKEADEEPPKRNYYYYEEVSKPPILVPPFPAKPENIAKAKVIVSRLDAMGGTNIDAALDIAVRLNNKRFGKPENKANSTESAAGTPSELESPVTSSTTEVTTESPENLENVKALEPIIIFLTDGDPTVGETNPSRIITRLSEKNYGAQKATIFSLAFGEDADRKFLRKISLRNDGFMRHIYEGADAHLQLRDFYRQVSSPLLANVKFTYPSNQVKGSTVTKDEFRTFYAGSEVVVAGQLAEGITELTPQLSGFCGVVDDGKSKKKYEKNTKVPIPLNKQGYLPLERLWAYLSIKQLLDKKDAADDSDKSLTDEETPEKKALNLALKYEFVTPLTSLVVVKPNETSAVDAESVDNKKNYYDSSYLAGGVPLSSHLFSAPAGVAGYQTASLALSPMSANIAYRPPTLSSSGYADFEESEALVDDYDNQGMSIPYSAILSFPSAKRKAFRPELNTSHRNVHDVFPTASTTPVPIVPQTTNGPTRLQEYHLDNFKWAESLLEPANDSLVLHLNETVTLIVTKDTNAPMSPSGDAECVNAVQGGEGLCVYLTRCQSAQTITVDDYKSNYCVVPEGYAGVCCPRKDIDL